MGILNVTPDSFSDGGEFLDAGRAVVRGLAMLDEGAEILDIGGESTRPGATALGAEEEQRRVMPVLAAVLRARPEAIVSVDTYHAATARAALEMGAEIINDVSGLRWDEGMAAVLAEYQPGVVLMHTRGRPGEWAGLPGIAEDEVVPMVMAGLRESVAKGLAAGIGRERIVVDPGFGFGKRGRENVALLAGLGRLRELGSPVLVGSSRKRFLTGGVVSEDAEVRLAATTAANVAAVLAGVQVLRVHDVAAARAGVDVADGILEVSMVTAGNS